ncbi:hypothetical protein DM01DRAFT_255647 [Hesseltinella vesiculosa]|uniref:P-loop containing nucleoside triphosphate hydrolase protein n=1 Tax=Hesseltinella vesiculosa TaxID=101127 RepID=A0A1X2GG06_9FUNG|nr:hypothetical protein DM01DRAFT_255647 [Hesseltinella vesiculosa]
MGHGGRWTTAKQQDELRKFLATIDMDEAPPPEARVGTPDDLIVHLMEHQKIGLQWMSKQENSINKGGLLADDMGLGKTIQALALIVSRRCSDAVDLDTLQALDAITQGKLNVDERVKIKTTLVVCPIGLMEQWATEIRQKTRNLSVYVYHGSSRKREVSYLAQFDIVISSYSIISMESSPDSEAVSPFAKCIFHRIVLDEAHSIKNRQTKAARACFHLEADYRWCLTATPLQNAVTDFFSLIHFLRIRPYNDWSNFRMEVGNVIRKDTSAMKKLQIIVKGICLRRSKKATIDGQPIINLPERTVHFTHVDFTDDERQFYDILDKNVQQRFNKYLEAGTVMRNYSNVLLLLLRLRQACLHPSLTTIERPDEAATAANAEKLATTVDARVLDRLKAAKEELASVECPICMDTADKPQVIFHCGHILCRECLCSYVNTSTDYDNNNKTCPQCRGQLDTARIIPLQAFLKVHLPDLCEPEPEDTDEEILARAQTYLSSTKIDTMLEILEETREETNGEDKTIIFSQFTSMLDLIQSGLDSKGIKYGRYDGTMSLQNRNRVIRDFYADADMTVLLVSTKCGSLGLNLTMANRVILMDIWWNPALENQAIDRVHRIGQTKDVVVHRIFVNNTVEDRILELQKRKQGIADGALGEGTTKIARLGLQEMMFLFRGNPLPPSDPNSTGASS